MRQHLLIQHPFFNNLILHTKDSIFKKNLVHYKMGIVANYNTTTIILSTQPSSSLSCVSGSTQPRSRTLPDKLFQLLPSGRRYSVVCQNQLPQKQFIPQAVTLMNTVKWPTVISFRSYKHMQFCTHCLYSFLRPIYYIPLFWCAHTCCVSLSHVFLPLLIVLTHCYWKFVHFSIPQASHD